MFAQSRTTGPPPAAAAAGRRVLPAERRAQPWLADPPEVVLHAVDERHGDLVPVLAQVSFRLGDVAFLPGHAEVSGDPGDNRAGLVAQVAAGPPEQGDLAISRRHPLPPRRPGARPNSCESPGGADSFACCIPSSITLVASTYGVRSTSKRWM